VRPRAIAPRLFLLSIGNQLAHQPALMPPVQFADKDAREAASFLPNYLVSPDGLKSLPGQPEDQVVLTGVEASERSIIQKLDRLHERLQTKQFNKGDIVVVMICSHVLDLGKTTVIASADMDPERTPPMPAIPAQDVSELLGKLTDYGCRVVVFLDGVHDVGKSGFKSSIKSWVRDLQMERRVITFVGSRERPSGVDATAQRGRFSLGIQGAFDVVVAADKAQDQPYTLEEFARAVDEKILSISGRQQYSYCYIPPSLSPQTLFARP
jgi:hypothetical protein